MHLFPVNFMLSATKEQSTEHFHRPQAKTYIQQIQSITLWLKKYKYQEKLSAALCSIHAKKCGVQPSV